MAKLAGVPNHDGSPRSAEDTLVDVPKNIGPIRSATSWVDRISFGDRAGSVFVGGAFATLAYILITEGYPRRLSIWKLEYLVVFALAGAVAYWVFGADAHASYIGKDGLAITRLRFRMWPVRRVLRFADADDVETRFTRVFSDGVHAIYSHTDVQFVWLDRQGQEVFRIATSIREPAATLDPDEPLDLSPLSAQHPGHEGVLALAAIEAFHQFKDGRDAAPYR